MSAGKEPSLGDIFGQEIVEELGNPEERNSYLDTDPILNMDYSRFKNPDLDFWTTKATNAASNLSLGSNSDDNSEFGEVLKDFRRNFADYKTQKPVYVSEEVLEEIGDHTVGFLKIQEDPRMYPVTVKSFEEFKDHLSNIPAFDAEELEKSGFEDADQEKARKEYKEWLEQSALENDFIVPAYANNSELPAKFNTSLVVGGNQFIGDPSSDEIFETYQEADSNITEIKLDEGYAVQVDAKDYGESDLNAFIEEGTLILTADEEEIYRSEYVEGGFKEVEKENFNSLTGSYVVEVV